MNVMVLEGQTFGTKLKSVCVLSHPVMSDSLQPHGLQPARLFRPWGF